MIIFEDTMIECLEKLRCRCSRMKRSSENSWGGTQRNWKSARKGEGLIWQEKMSYEPNKIVVVRHSPKHTGDPTKT